MLRSLFSPSWYRVANLKPRLRRHTQIHRHHYRGELWYVMQDHVSGRYYRFTPTAYQVIGMMDGRLSVQDLWEKVTVRFGDEAPTQGEMVNLLSQLHAADVLLCDVPPDTAELFRRHTKGEKSKWQTYLRSPLSLRFPLFKPERFLARTVPLVRPLFSIYGALLWLAVVGSAAVLAGLHWQELTGDLVDRVLSAQNLLILWLVFPVVKALHELGHGYAIKALGGEVPEMGIMLLVLMPVPYVDASSSLAFREKWQRFLVGAAGMMVELFVAALALFVWLHLPPGTLLRSLCFNAILIAGVSTILFNGNPLLRYDGYYMLSDLLGIMNLSQRSTDYWGYLFKRHLFGLRQVEAPYAAPGERFWFISYSLAAYAYRLFLYFAIITFISNKFFFIGIMLALWALVGMIVVPACKRIHFVITSPTLRENRGRAVMATGGLVLAALIVLFLLPFPSWTRTEGVVWAPEESQVRAGTEGFVDQVRAVPNGPVKKGEVLVTCRDPLLAAQVKVLEAQLRELEVRYYDLVAALDLVQARLVQEDLEHIRSSLARAREKESALTIHSPGDGLFILPAAQDLPGRFVKQGDLLGYVINSTGPTVRVVAPQSDIDLMRQRQLAVNVRLASEVDRVIPAAIKRVVPGAQERLPSTVLGTIGGGEVPIDPRDQDGLKTFENLFQMDLEILEPVARLCIGGRVYVRFDQGYIPLGLQWYRTLRQLLLKRFNV
jgi:putative peptide zinc metalloprotease protein